uniref:Uncharacterized protein n=1 Tax=viral metagenome TaxID=1070528 RepID=A0A6M3K7K5_9ZZZZ
MQLENESRAQLKATILQILNDELEKDRKYGGPSTVVAPAAFDNLIRIAIVLWGVFKQYVPEPWRSIVSIILDALDNPEPVF